MGTRRTDSRAVGAILGTLTLRYPISNSRVAPYVYLGGGGIYGGGQRDTFIIGSLGENEFSIRTAHSGSRTEPVGQVGGGFEVRLTPHIGLINDFSWNVVSGSNNNFGMIRSGINVAF